MGTLGRTSFSETISAGNFFVTMIDLDLTLVDASFVYSFLPDRRFSPSLFGGRVSSSTTFGCLRCYSA